MPPHLVQPYCVALGQALDLGLISRHELRALSIGFLVPKASCSRVHYSFVDMVRWCLDCNEWSRLYLKDSPFLQVQARLALLLLFVELRFRLLAS